MTGQVIRGDLHRRRGDAVEQVSGPDGITATSVPRTLANPRPGRGLRPQSKTVRPRRAHLRPLPSEPHGRRGARAMHGAMRPEVAEQPCSCRTWGKCAMPTCINDQPDEEAQPAAQCATNAHRSACRTNARTCPCPSFGVCRMPSCRDPNAPRRRGTDVRRMPTARPAGRTRGTARCPRTAPAAASCRDPNAQPLQPEGPRCSTDAHRATCRTNPRLSLSVVWRLRDDLLPRGGGHRARLRRDPGA